MNCKTAVILCGGKGTRLGLLGRKIPKSLVKVNEHPIIWYIINTLKKNSFNHFILPIGYKGKMIEKYLKKNKNFKKDRSKILKSHIFFLEKINFSKNQNFQFSKIIFRKIFFENRVMKKMSQKVFGSNFSKNKYFYLNPKAYEQA